MLIEMEENSDNKAVEEVVKIVKREGFDVLLKNGQGRKVIAVLGLGVNGLSPKIFERMSEVRKITKTDKPLSADFSAFQEASVFFKENIR